MAAAGVLDYWIKGGHIYTCFLDVKCVHLHHVLQGF
jgi:hypothetical protein